MPITSITDPGRRVVFTNCTGLLTMAEVAEFCVQLAQDPAFDPAFSHLNDLSAVSDIQVSFQELKTFITQKLDPFSETSRRVFVAGQPLVFGMARMYENLINHPNFAVVQTLEEGRRHLGLEPEMTRHPSSRRGESAP